MRLAAAPQLPAVPPIVSDVLGAAQQALTSPMGAAVATGVTVFLVSLMMIAIGTRRAKPRAARSTRRARVEIPSYYPPSQFPAMPVAMPWSSQQAMRSQPPPEATPAPFPQSRHTPVHTPVMHAHQAPTSAVFPIPRPPLVPRVDLPDLSWSSAPPRALTPLVPARAPSPSAFDTAQTRPPVMPQKPLSSRIPSAAPSSVRPPFPSVRPSVAGVPVAPSLAKPPSQRPASKAPPLPPAALRVATIRPSAAMPPVAVTPPPAVMAQRIMFVQVPVPFVAGTNVNVSELDFEDDNPTEFSEPFFEAEDLANGRAVHATAPRIRKVEPEKPRYQSTEMPAATQIPEPTSVFPLMRAVR